MDSRGWSIQETRCLISFWAEESVQQKLEDSYHNRAIYKEISEKMEGNGYNRSWQQCQRKIKHLRNDFRKAKDSNMLGRDSVSCPFYEELDRVLGDRLSCFPGECDVLDSELDYSQDEPLFNSTVDAIQNASVTLSNTTHAETQGDDGRSDDTTGPDASSSSSSSQSSSASSSSSTKRPSASSSGQTRRKRSKFETTLEAISKALCNSRDQEVLLQMQRAQHAHEEKLFGMMMQSITSLASTVASVHRPSPGHAPSYPWCQPVSPRVLKQEEEEEEEEEEEPQEEPPSLEVKTEVEEKDLEEDENEEKELEVKKEAEEKVIKEEQESNEEKYYEVVLAPAEQREEESGEQEHVKEESIDGDG